MFEGKEIYRSVKLNDNIKMSSLSVMDQLRLVFSKLSNDDVKELDTNEKLTEDTLRKKAALGKFIDKATSKLGSTKSGKATLSVPSVFLPYIDDVVDTELGRGRYYTFNVHKKDLPMEVKHFFIVEVMLKDN